ERLKAVEQMKIAQEQAEKIKREEALRKQRELDQRTREQRQKEAADFSRKALEAYRRSNFQLAEKLFEKSVELDPENNQIYCQYGISTYKNGNDLKAIALLKLADYGDFNRYERDYYKGLAYFRLKDLDPAESAFASVLSLNDQKLAPSAAFFLGVVRFQKEKYNEAKDAFEFVLDQSTDPALDRQADSYIEQIANILSFQEKQKKPWTLSFNAGLLSDSNILSAATNTATEQSGYRISIGAGVDYRFRYKEKSESSLRWSVSDLNSIWNSRFQYIDSFQRYDPLVTSLTNLWKWRRKWGQTPVQIGLTPGFETIHMDVDGVSNQDFLTRFYSLRRRELILSSIVLKNDYSFVIRPQWLSTPSIEIRSDTSMIESSEEEDQKALKMNLNWNNAWFMDEKLSRGHLFDIGAIVNSALGNNQKFQRWDLSYSYITAIFKESGLSARLNFAGIKYPNHSSSRSDSQINASLGLRTPLGKKWVWANSLGHSINSSNIDSFQYSRTTLQSSFEWSDLF
ncbi:MAG: tetratricopeptide repeat protein, partial [Bdellovibrio sp.]